MDNITLWTFFEVFVTVFESSMVIFFICTFMNHDLGSIKGKALFAAGVVCSIAAVSAANFFIHYEGILGAAYVLIYFVYALVCLKGNGIKKLYAAMLTVMVLVCVNAVVTSVFTAVSGVPLPVIYEENSYGRILVILCVQVTLVSIFMLMLKVTGKGRVSLDKGEWRLVISVMIISFVALTFIHSVQLNTELSEKDSIMMLISEICIVSVNAVCFSTVTALSRRNAETNELKLKQSQQEYRIRYAENVRKQYEEIRRLRHDMKQNFAVISALHRDGKFSEAQEFVSGCSDKLANLEALVDTGNDFINAILNSKLSAAKERGIDAVFSVSSDISGTDDTDLCNLLGNMLDNAIEAAEKCAERKFIEGKMISDPDKLLVTVTNSTEKPVLENNSELKTTKPDTAAHGFGMKTIRAIAEKYSGSINIFESGESFTCQVLIYKADYQK